MLTTRWMVSRELVVAVLMTVVCGLGRPVAAQSPNLKIVVLEGEDAVNVIQQKTAVRALVEVRDRNNLPVPGALVTFSVGGRGGAAFANGVRTLTVTTNAAGQAAVTGLTPTTAGAVRIQVSAAFQGQTATAVIEQTIVATAAQAAALGGAAAGGGLSTGAILGIVGGVAAVAGGVAVAGAVAGSGEDQQDRAQTFLANCAFAVSPTSVTVPVTGGTAVITVVASPSPCLSPTWIVFIGVSGSFVSADRTSGSGNGTVTLTIAPFTPMPGFSARSGAVGVANAIVQILQPGPLSVTAMASQ